MATNKVLTADRAMGRAVELSQPLTKATGKNNRCSYPVLHMNVPTKYFTSNAVIAFDKGNHQIVRQF